MEGKKKNLVANLKEAPDSGRAVRDTLLQIERDEKSLQRNLNEFQKETGQDAKNNIL
ncbi:MAG: hypothetical protein ABSB94_09970 [Syntrophorhabdales bacterium]